MIQIHSDHFGEPDPDSHQRENPVAVKAHNRAVEAQTEAHNGAVEATMEPWRLTMEPRRLTMEGVNRTNIAYSYHYDEDPDPHKKDRIRIRIKVKSRNQIQVCIQVKSRELRCGGSHRSRGGRATTDTKEVIFEFLNTTVRYLTIRVTRTNAIHLYTPNSSY
jgi:hypothetical protein